MLNPKKLIDKNGCKQVFNLKSKLEFGKYNGKTVEEICDDDPAYIDWCLNNDIFNLDRWAKMYLSARRRDDGKPDMRDFKGVIDYGPREVDEFVGLPDRYITGVTEECTEIDLWDE